MEQEKYYRARVRHVSRIMDFYIYGHSPCRKKIPENGIGYTYYMLPLNGNNNTYSQIDETTLQELVIFDETQRNKLKKTIDTVLSNYNCIDAMSQQSIVNDLLISILNLYSAPFGGTTPVESVPIAQNVQGSRNIPMFIRATVGT